MGFSSFVALALICSQHYLFYHLKVHLSPQLKTCHSFHLFTVQELQTSCDSELLPDISNNVCASSFNLFLQSRSNKQCLLHPTLGLQTGFLLTHPTEVSLSRTQDFDGSFQVPSKTGLTILSLKLRIRTPVNLKSSAWRTVAEQQRSYSAEMKN